MITTPHTKGAQLASPIVVGTEVGKQLNTMMKAQYTTANALIASPNFPKLHLAGGNS